MIRSLREVALAHETLHDGRWKGDRSGKEAVAYSFVGAVSAGLAAATVSLVPSAIALAGVTAGVVGVGVVGYIAAKGLGHSANKFGGALAAMGRQSKNRMIESRGNFFDRAGNALARGAYAMIGGAGNAVSWAGCAVSEATDVPLRLASRGIQSLFKGRDAWRNKPDLFRPSRAAREDSIFSSGFN